MSKDATSETIAKVIDDRDREPLVVDTRPPTKVQDFANHAQKRSSPPRDISDQA
jgi:hypothetical protein